MTPSNVDATDNSRAAIAGLSDLQRDEAMTDETIGIAEGMTPSASQLFGASASQLMHLPEFKTVIEEE